MLARSADEDWLNFMPPPKSGLYSLLDDHSPMPETGQPSEQHTNEDAYPIMMEAFNMGTTRHPAHADAFAASAADKQRAVDRSTVSKAPPPMGPALKGLGISYLQDWIAKEIDAQMAERSNALRPLPASLAITDAAAPAGSSAAEELHDLRSLKDELATVRKDVLEQLNTLPEYQAQLRTLLQEVQDQRAAAAAELLSSGAPPHAHSGSGASDCIHAEWLVASAATGSPPASPGSAPPASWGTGPERTESSTSGGSLLMGRGPDQVARLEAIVDQLQEELKMLAQMSGTKSSRASLPELLATESGTLSEGAMSPLQVDASSFRSDPPAFRASDPKTAGLFGGHNPALALESCSLSSPISQTLPPARHARATGSLTLLPLPPGELPPGALPQATSAGARTRAGAGAQSERTLPDSAPSSAGRTVDSPANTAMTAVELLAWLRAASPQPLAGGSDSASERSSAPVSEIDGVLDRMMHQVLAELRVSRAAAQTAAGRAARSSSAGPQWHTVLGALAAIAAAPIAPPSGALALPAPSTSACVPRAGAAWGPEPARAGAIVSLLVNESSCEADPSVSVRVFSTAAVLAALQDQASPAESAADAEAAAVPAVRAVLGATADAVTVHLVTADSSQSTRNAALHALALTCPSALPRTTLLRTVLCAEAERVHRVLSAAQPAPDSPCNTIANFAPTSGDSVSTDASAAGLPAASYPARAAVAAAAAEAARAQRCAAAEQALADAVPQRCTRVYAALSAVVAALQRAPGGGAAAASGVLPPATLAARSSVARPLIAMPMLRASWTTFHNNPIALSEDSSANADDEASLSSGSADRHAVRSGSAVRLSELASGAFENAPGGGAWGEVAAAATVESELSKLKPQDLAAVEAKVLQLLAEESAGASAADMFALQQHYRQAAQEAIYMQMQMQAQLQWRDIAAQQDAAYSAQVNSVFLLMMQLQLANQSVMMDHAVVSAQQQQRNKPGSIMRSRVTRVINQKLSASMNVPLPYFEAADRHAESTLRSSQQSAMASQMASAMGSAMGSGGAPPYPAGMTSTSFASANSSFVSVMGGGFPRGAPGLGGHYGTTSPLGTPPSHGGAHLGHRQGSGLPAHARTAPALHHSASVPAVGFAGVRSRASLGSRAGSPALGTRHASFELPASAYALPSPRSSATRPHSAASTPGPSHAYSPVPMGSLARISSGSPGPSSGAAPRGPSTGTRSAATRALSRTTSLIYEKQRSLGALYSRAPRTAPPLEGSPYIKQRSTSVLPDKQFLGVCTTPPAAQPNSQSSGSRSSTPRAASTPGSASPRLPRRSVTPSELTPSPLTRGSSDALTTPPARPTTGRSQRSSVPSSLPINRTSSLSPFIEGSGYAAAHGYSGSYSSGYATAPQPGAQHAPLYYSAGTPTSHASQTSLYGSPQQQAHPAQVAHAQQYPQQHFGSMQQQQYLAMSYSPPSYGCSSTFAAPFPATALRGSNSSPGIAAARTPSAAHLPHALAGHLGESGCVPEGSALQSDSYHSAPQLPRLSAESAELGVAAPGHPNNGHAGHPNGHPNNCWPAGSSPPAGASATGSAGAALAAGWAYGGHGAAAASRSWNASPAPAPESGNTSGSTSPTSVLEHSAARAPSQADPARKASPAKAIASPPAMSAVSRQHSGMSCHPAHGYSAAPGYAPQQPAWLAAPHPGYSPSPGSPGMMFGSPTFPQGVHNPAYTTPGLAHATSYSSFLYGQPPPGAPYHAAPPQPPSGFGSYSFLPASSHSQAQEVPRQRTQR